MLVLARKMGELNFPALMEVYLEGNLENGEELWPEAPEGLRLQRAEDAFRQYLSEDFFAVPGAVYCVWAESKKYVSALRLEPYRDGLLLEALETDPEYRRQGYAVKLMRSVIAEFPEKRIYSHVGKRNFASIACHEACGFRKLLDYAVYIDGSVARNAWTYVIGE